MNCSQSREEFGAYLEGLLDDDLRGQVESHVAECPGCQAELQEVRRLVAELSRDAAAVAPVGFANAVMDQILQRQATELRRLRMRRRIRVFGISGVMAVGIAFLAMSGLWLAEPVSAKTAAEVMAQGVEATPILSTVHFVGKMRTIPHDNFSFIGSEYDFVPIEVWREFGKKPKWRVEKPGRVAVMDGNSTVMLIRPDRVVQFPHASNGAFDTGWLLELANVRDTLTQELLRAQAKRWDLKLTHETTAAGSMSIVTLEAKSGLPAGDYLKDKFYDLSDMRRVYRFDTNTRRLTGFDAYLHRADGDLLAVSIERIEYEKPIDPTVFNLKLPDKVNLYSEPEPLPDNAKYEKMKPEEAARAFFEACGRKDWDEVRKFESSGLDEPFKKYLGGIELVRLGKPFQSAISLLNGDWFVPYEIKWPKETGKCVVRNDNPAKRWIVFQDKEVQDPKKLAKLEKIPDNEKYEKMTPKEAVKALFDAFEKKDAVEAQKFLDGSISTELLKRAMDVRSFMDVHIGEPVLDKDTGFWQVPVEFSVTKKHNLALRPNKKAKRYIIDGGI